MMTNEQENHVVQFLETFNDYRYSQAIVCYTVNASVFDVNEWRRRKIIPVEGFEKRGRIFYDGETLLRIGILAEIAPFCGPTFANEIADYFLTFDLTTIDDKVVVWDSKESTESTTLDGSEELKVIRHGSLVFPAGRLIKQWMVGAELRLLPDAPELKELK